MFDSMRGLLHDEYAFTGGDGKKQALPDVLSEVLTTHNDTDAVIAEMRAAGRSADLTF